MKNTKTIFTTGEVARFCRVMPITVCKWFDSGRLRGYRIPGSQDRRIPKEYLLRFMREYGMQIPEELNDEPSEHLAKTSPDLLKACKDVLAALEESTQETGEILRLEHVLPGVHESAMERLKNVIARSEGRQETCFDCGEKFDGATGICDLCHDERDRIDEVEKTRG